MSSPDRPDLPERPQSNPPERGIALPSWVDAAITRSRDDEQGDPGAETLSEIVLEPDDVEPVGTAPFAEAGRRPESVPTAAPDAPPQSEQVIGAASAPRAVPTPSPAATASAVTPRRRGIALPWLLSALLFAAAAAVMAFMIWFKPAR